MSDEQDPLSGCTMVSRPFERATITGPLDRFQAVNDYLLKMRYRVTYFETSQAERTFEIIAERGAGT